jgi:hypothetical protein
VLARSHKKNPNLWVFFRVVAASYSSTTMSSFCPLPPALIAESQTRQRQVCQVVMSHSLPTQPGPKP